MKLDRDHIESEARRLADEHLARSGPPDTVATQRDIHRAIVFGVVNALCDALESEMAGQVDRLRTAVRAELDKIAALAPEDIPVISNMRMESNGTFTADVALPGRAVVDADPQLAIERVANLVGVRTDPECQDTENWDAAKTEPNAASPIGDPSKDDVQ